MGWRPGDGGSIGIDPIEGLKNSFILPRGLFDYLHDFNIYTFNQACNQGIGPFSSSYWMIVEDVDLNVVWKEEWTCYIGGLSHGGIRFSAQKDCVLWLHNTENEDGI